MKLVIDIPEKVYTWIQREWVKCDFDSVINHALNGIKNGTPLPKGHGRLIDADAFFKSASIKFYTTNLFSHIISTIYNAPTVIEADKEEQDE